MDIELTAEALLRDSGYSTHIWIGKTRNTLVFEDACVVGFLHIFDTATSLLEEWLPRERDILSVHALAFRAAGAKAWNVYTVLVTEELASEDVERSVSRIEENLKFTRKLARTGVRTTANLRNVLLPLLPVWSRPRVEAAHYAARLQTSLELKLKPNVVEAFLNDMKGDDLVRIIEDES